MDFATQKTQLDQVTSKNEKISWKRKRKNIQNLVAELDPLETEILSLMTRKSTIIDKITQIRSTMVAECIHPVDELVESADGSYMTCKFCDRAIGVVLNAHTDPAHIDG